MDDEAVVYYKGLKEDFGIDISRTHLARLEKAGKFPKRHKPFVVRGSRIFWKRKDIKAWLGSR